jgi:5-(carboxyamino)imidazole ribonucleotide mutase
VTSIIFTRHKGETLKFKDSTEFQMGSIEFQKRQLFKSYRLRSDASAKPNMTNTASKAKTRIGVVMGSSSDWDTMQHAVQILQQFGIDHEAKVVSAHRMPDEMFSYAETALDRGLFAIIAGAGGAAHLPGMLAAKTVVPVLGVPVASKHLQGVDSLHSIVQMPKGIPVATFAIGAAGAANAALFAVAMLAQNDAALQAKLEQFRKDQTAAAQGMTLPPVGAA